MNWLKKIFNKKVDERQEMDLLRVEHYSFWLMFWLLAIEIIVQGIILDGGDKILGEWIVFMATAVFSVAGFIRKGVWSYAINDKTFILDIRIRRKRCRG